MTDVNSSNERFALIADRLRTAADRIAWMREHWGQRNPYRKYSQDWIDWASAEQEQFDMVDAEEKELRTLAAELVQE